MRSFAAFGVLLWFWLSVSPATASVVPPYPFEKLVSEADLIFTGEVIETESRWSGTAIVTAVTFRVERTLKGDPRALVTLEFLGGQVGDVSLDVAGVPRFTRGDRAVMCVDARRASVSPVIGFNQGRFPINRQPITGREFVTMHNGAALPAVSALGQRPPSISAVPLRTMTREELEDDILRVLRAALR